MFEYLPERPLEPPEEKPIAYCDKTACTTSPMTTSRTAKRRL